MMEVFIFLFFGIIVFSLMILGIVLWFLMLIDAVKRKFKNDNDKVIWIILIALLGIIGAIIYYFVIKRPNKH
ncbi:MAG: PLDc N-terminal domain-containing protein [Nanoarchaeota archaeon]|nr:PLDc N-terminal domain-containing protein [Nanoarchaeota archaeon]